jgi:hypothetical protein
MKAGSPFSGDPAILDCAVAVAYMAIRHTPHFSRVGGSFRERRFSAQ